MLTARLGLGGPGDPPRSATRSRCHSTAAFFDVVWTQNSGMNIADKARLYAGFHRVLRPGGLLAIRGADGRARAGPSSIPSCGRATPRRASCARPRRCAR